VSNLQLADVEGGELSEGAKRFQVTEREEVLENSADQLCELALRALVAFAERYDSPKVQALLATLEIGISGEKASKWTFFSMAAKYTEP